METVPYVDLKRFMGDWYVVANIPTFVEKGLQPGGELQAEPGRHHRDHLHLQQGRASTGR
jgi:lipocalin